MNYYVKLSFKSYPMIFPRSKTCQNVQNHENHITDSCCLVDSRIPLGSSSRNNLELIQALSRLAVQGLTAKCCIQQHRKHT